MLTRSGLLLLGLTITLPSTAQTLQYTRTSTFWYDPSGPTGLLVREIIEPNDAALCLVKAYDFDANGNRTVAVARNCGTLAGDTTTRASTQGEAATPTGCPATPPSASCDAQFMTRKSTTSFAATAANPLPGQFPTSSTNALNQTEMRQFDPRFGTMLQLTGPNQLQTQWTYDDLGRKLTETRNSNVAGASTTTTWNYELCSNLPAGTGTCPNSGLAVYRVRVLSDGAPASSTYHDTLNRVIRTESQDFDGNLVKKDSVYDMYGNLVKTSKPFITEGSQVWTTLTPDELGRVKLVSEPPVTSGSNTETLQTATAYHGLTTTITVSNGGGASAMPGATPSVQVKTITKNSQGQVVKVTQQ
jgi:hypothetical protein